MNASKQIIEARKGCEVNLTPVECILQFRFTQINISANYVPAVCNEFRLFSIISLVLSDSKSDVLMMHFRSNILQS